MVSSWDIRTQLCYFHNNGDGSFTERTRESGIIGEIGGLNMIQADYNDGRPDVLVLRGAWLGAMPWNVRSFKLRPPDVKLCVPPGILPPPKSARQRQSPLAAAVSSRARHFNFSGAGDSATNRSASSM